MSMGEERVSVPARRAAGPRRTKIESGGWLSRNARRAGLMAGLFAAWGASPATPQATVGRTVYIDATDNQEANCNELRRVLDNVEMPRFHGNALHVRLGPGAYFCFDTVSIPSYVTVEGAGRATTSIGGNLSCRSAAPAAPG